jgi:RND superfamily putative drug exporter
MSVLARFVIVHRLWVLLAWLLITVAGAYGAPKATSALGYDLGLPGSLRIKEAGTLA